MVRLFYLLRKGNQVLCIWLRVNKLFEPRKRACFSHPDRIYTLNSHLSALKAHITIKSHAYAFAEIFEASSTNSVDPDLTAPVVRSRSTLFASLLMSKFSDVRVAILLEL